MSASIDSPDSRHWFALRVGRNQERRTADDLRAKGLEVFVPMKTVRREWSDRVKISAMPLIKGYVYCRCEPADWQFIWSSAGIARDGDRCRGSMIMPAGEIERLRKITDSSCAV